MNTEKIMIPSDEEIKKAQDIFTLIILAKMSLTEINTLTENERILLAGFFVEKAYEENKAMKECSKH